MPLRVPSPSQTGSQSVQVAGELVEAFPSHTPSSTRQSLAALPPPPGTRPAPTGAARNSATVMLRQATAGRPPSRPRGSLATMHAPPLRSRDADRQDRVSRERSGTSMKRGSLVAAGRYRWRTRRRRDPGERALVELQAGVALERLEVALHLVLELLVAERRLDLLLHRIERL